MTTRLSDVRCFSWPEDLDVVGGRQIFSFGQSETFHCDKCFVCWVRTWVFVLLGWVCTPMTRKFEDLIIDPVEHTWGTSSVRVVTGAGVPERFRECQQYKQCSLVETSLPTSHVTLFISDCDNKYCYLVWHPVFSPGRCHQTRHVIHAYMPCHITCAPRLYPISMIPKLAFNVLALSYIPYTWDILIPFQTIIPHVLW